MCTPDSSVRASRRQRIMSLWLGCHTTKGQGHYCFKDTTSSTKESLFTHEEGIIFSHREGINLTRAGITHKDPIRASPALHSPSSMSRTSYLPSPPKSTPCPPHDVLLREARLTTLKAQMLLLLGFPPPSCRKPRYSSLAEVRTSHSCNSYISLFRVQPLALSPRVEPPRSRMHGLGEPR
jgi:hypothetical protein